MKRRKRLTEWDCQALAQSREGSSSLTQPFHQWNISRDVNRGLHPRNRSETRPKGTWRTVCVNSSVNSPVNNPVNSGSVDLARSGWNPIHTADMEEEDGASVSASMEEKTAAMFDGTDRPSPNLPSYRKRPFSCVGGWSRRDSNVDPSLAEIGSSSDFYEEDDDDEMCHLLDSLPDSHYGLLGVTADNGPTSDLLSRFPAELLQNIFAFLPMEDLERNVSLVCKGWKAVIQDELFIPWKKLYHRYVAKDPEAEREVNVILKKNGIAVENQNYILNVVRCFASVLPSRLIDFQKILDCLKCHPSYQMAERSAAATFPDLRDDTGTMNAWAVVAMLILLSKDVPDIQKLITCLQRRRSPLKLTEVMEALYCLALLVYAMREEKIPITNRIHYKIFYSLHLLENESPEIQVSSHITSRNKPSMKTTNEQQQIINHEIQPGHVVKIMAFAGTGKTSTLIKYAEKRSHLRFLYVTFNKSIASHAANIFPRNVTCRTFHSLAFQETGRLYEQRKKINRSALTAFTANLVLPEGHAGFVRAKLVVKTLENFFASADPVIGMEHVPIWCKNNRGERQLVCPLELEFSVTEASKIWERMKSLDEVREMAYKMTHDGYLKLWQLRKPDLSSYDVIFVDEAQDCTPSIIEVIISQKCGKIFVGDPHQQIYTFRGAVNALCEVPHTHIYYLTQSFRFGAEIGYIGATILDVCKNVRNKILVGGTQKGTVRQPCQSKVAILCRSNSCVFDQAVHVTDGESPARIHIIGGPENFGLSKIYDLWILLQPETTRNREGLEVKDTFLKKWVGRGGFSSLKAYAVSSEDRELEGKMAIVEKYSQRIPELVERIETCNTRYVESADYVLGTVHKAKGMEFDTVAVTDDFLKVPLARHNLLRIGVPLDLSAEDECNLLYVAVTRAKNHLVITKSIENILTLAGEYSLQAELTSELLKEGPVLCSLSHCRNPIPEKSVLTMRRLPISYSDRSEERGGVLCHACVQQRVGNMTRLLLSPEIMETIENKVEHILIPRQIELLLHAL